jgi:hypothetical protein
MVLVGRGKCEIAEARPATPSPLEIPTIRTKNLPTYLCDVQRAPQADPMLKLPSGVLDHNEGVVAIGNAP